MKNALFYVLMFFTLISYAQKRELNLAADVWPLFTNVEGEKSILTDLVQEALTRMDITSTIKIKEFTDVIKEMNSGELDGSPAFWISEERKEKYLFSEPYLYNQLILVGRKGSDVSATSFNDLSGKKIGVVNNYDYGDFDKNQDITVISDVSNQKNLENLLSEMTLI